VADLRKLGKHETFYNAGEILRLGLVDEVVDFGVHGAETRTIPEDLLPANRMKSVINRKIESME
jgi:hypothetical protein